MSTRPYAAQVSTRPCAAPKSTRPYAAPRLAATRRGTGATRPMEVNR
jgi:hypothetical protein